MQIKVIKPAQQSKQEKKKVCAYVRVSTDSIEQEESLDNQTAYFQNYITANPEWEFVGIYSDQGISGFKEKRPGFQRMISDAREGKIDLIVVKSVSRFARNTETVLKFSRELKNIGVGIFFELQNINTLSGTGELMLTIIAAFAQAESEGAADNARLTYKRKFESGIPAYGLESTYGYMVDEYGILRIEEKEAEVVRKIYELALQKVWPSKIKGYLNRMGIPGPAGGDWDDTGIFRILHNVSYKGDAVLQKTYLDSNRKRHVNKGQKDQWYITDNHPAIISTEDWENVQKILKSRSEKLKTPLPPAPEQHRYSRSTYPLSNKLFCPLCGEKLIHKWGNRRREYWACRKNLKEGKNACKGVWLPAKEAEAWGEITEEVTVIKYEDDYGMSHFTAFPKDEYEQSKDCPYRKD